MQVTIKDVSVEWGGKPTKKWGKATVTYDYNGNSRRQNVMSFSNPEVFKKVQELVGETVDVEVGKNDKDFTEWRSISVAATGGAAPSGSAPSANNTKTNTYQPRDFESKEERARRQVLIVKQSSLSAAVAILTPGAKAALDQKTVLALAQTLVDWVLDTPHDSGSIEDMEQDIPF